MEKGRWAASSRMEGNGVVLDGYMDESRSAESAASIATSSSRPTPEFLASSSSSSGAIHAGFIEHHVSKMDTLAGLAIKYGIEVMDIKRANNLATDLQMYAHKTIWIPLLERYPPSSSVSSSLALSSISEGNCFDERTPSHRPHDKILDSIRSVELKLKPPRYKASSTLRAMQEYYGLLLAKRYPQHEGTELASYWKASECSCDENGSHYTGGSNSQPMLDHHCKSRSLMDDENSEIAEDKSAADNGDTDRSIRRRQKAECSTFSNRSVDKERKGFALKPKLALRADLNKSQQNLIAMDDTPVSVGLQPVRKSSSTSDLIISDISSSLWSTSKWSLKPDSFGLSIFDNLPLQISSWRNKAARD